MSDHDETLGIPPLFDVLFLFPTYAKLLYDCFRDEGSDEMKFDRIGTRCDEARTGLMTFSNAEHETDPRF